MNLSESMRLLLITISITTALIILSACSSISSFSYENISIENKPKHHIEMGFQNTPFVETAASKGIAFYLRRFWGSIFTPDIPDGHALSEKKSMQLDRKIVV